MKAQFPLHLFERIGIELEYMIVDQRTLGVLPIADELLKAVAGEYVSEVKRGPLCWQNELALHVIELKVDEPVMSLEGLPGRFEQNILQINDVLQPLNGRLMPTGMHPWMDPDSETRLWPHDNAHIYQAFDRIFGCRSHGWANLQSVHLNLPFADDDEFARLHAAVRVLMPIMPALAASSPVVDGRLNGILDNRLQVYRTNCRHIPSVTGKVIPEAIFSINEYQEKLLQQIYRDIAPFDPEGDLQYEWLNARGAIARFERNTIEIRTLDVQECPAADLAICQAVLEALKALIEEKWTGLSTLKSMESEALEAIFLQVLAQAEDTIITNESYLHLFGLRTGPCTVVELWSHLIDSLCAEGPVWTAASTAILRTILHQGTLARRIIQALGEEPSAEQLIGVYRRLCECLSRGELFVDRN